MSEYIILRGFRGRLALSDTQIEKLWRLLSKGGEFLEALGNSGCRSPWPSHIFSLLIFISPLHLRPTFADQIFKYTLHHKAIFTT
jgi:hypothetical protein